MSKPTILVILALVIVVGGGALLYANFSSGQDLDEQAQALLTQVTTEQAKQTPDAAVCRRLLAEIRAHPQRKADPGMVRGEAWLHLALGSTQDALRTLEPNLQLDATPADHALGVQILRRRHAESGAADQAFRASVFAQEHYAATGAAESLFDAWQMAVRGEDREGLQRGEQLAKDLVQGHGATTLGRLVAILDASGYPDMQEDEGDEVLDEEQLRVLESEFEDPPAELDLALAWIEISGATPQSISAGERRLDLVLSRFPSSLTAKLLRAVVDHRFRRFPEAKERLNWLIDQHPEHRRSVVWKKMLERVEADSIKKL